MLYYLICFVIVDNAYCNQWDLIQENCLNIIHYIVFYIQRTTVTEFGYQYNATYVMPLKNIMTTINCYCNRARKNNRFSILGDTRCPLRSYSHFISRPHIRLFVYTHRKPNTSYLICKTTLISLHISSIYSHLFNDKDSCLDNFTSNLKITDVG